jgi:hypothetical protein
MNNVSSLNDTLTGLQGDSGPTPERGVAWRELTHVTFKIGDPLVMGLESVLYATS